MAIPSVATHILKLREHTHTGRHKYYRESRGAREDRNLTRGRKSVQSHAKFSAT